MSTEYTVGLNHPMSGMGALLTTNRQPVVQIDAVNGLRTTDVEVFTDGSTGS